MERIRYKKSRQIQPNLFEYTGDHKNEPVAMQLFVYNDDAFAEFDPIWPTQIESELEAGNTGNVVMWLNMHGLHDVQQVIGVGQMLGLENFVIGDILNVNRRPRVEELDSVLFFSIKSILPSKDKSEHVRVEQISFVLKGNLLVSFQEKRSDFFAHIRERIRTHTGIVRKKHSDYLLHLLLDAVMENFYITLEFHEEQIETVLREAKTSDDPAIHERIQKTREQLNFLKKSVKPLHDALFSLKSATAGQQHHGIKKSNLSFFSRLNQKSLELLEQIEYDLNALDSASNFYFASQSRRMNEIMKVLTAVSVIFMPLTFIVGVYGMNFDYLPELHYHNAYMVVWLVMVAIVGVMVYFFKKKNWF